MKKISIALFVSAVFASSALAEYLTLTTDNNKYTATIPDATLSTYTGFTGEVLNFDSTSAAPIIGTFTQDFTFDSGINVTVNATGNIAFKFVLRNNATVTLNNGFNITANKSFRLWAGEGYNDNNRGKLIINTTITGVTPLLFLFNKDVVLNPTTSTAFSEIDFFNNSTLTVTKNVTAQIGIRGTRMLYDGTISKAFNVDTTKKGVRSIGKIILDGTSFSATGYYQNQSGDEKDLADYQHVFSIQFANENIAESFNINNSESLADKPRRFSQFMTVSTFDGWLFENMNKNDTICSAYDLTSEAYASKIFINDNTLAELIESGAIEVSKDSTYNYIYTMTIPEPSTYAMVLGALALGFVAYRRRK